MDLVNIQYWAWIRKYLPSGGVKHLRPSVKQPYPIAESRSVTSQWLHLKPYTHIPLALTMSLQHQLPPKCSLFVATPQIIHLRSAASEKTLFKCETADGIVNAKASRDNSGLIAIADSHVVILYDTTRGNDRKYRLNNVHVGGERSMLAPLN